MADIYEKKGMDASALGQRLRSAREAAGMSTWTAAACLKSRSVDVSHATLANYERGTTRPSVAFLALLAELYAKSINWFLQSGPTLSGIQYRCLKGVTAAEKQQFEAESQRWLDAYRRLEGHLGCFLARKIALSTSESESGSDLADKLRAHLSLGIHPVPSVTEVLEGYGVRVVEVATAARIDGLAAHLAGEKIVVLSRSLPADRVRLNAAHELGHHLFEDVARKEASQSPLEKRAFEFASHFLLPRAVLVSAFEGYSMIRLVQFKERYGVSLAAMIYRAKEVGLIDERIYRKLWMEFSRRGWRTREPGFVLPDRASRFEKMIEGAIKSESVTWAACSRITGISEADLRTRLNDVLGSSEGR